MTPSFHKTCIVGVGAIGGWLGAGLARAGCNVSLLARGRTLAALQHDGLRLRTGSGDNQQIETHRVQATADPASLGLQDLVVIAVKSHRHCAKWRNRSRRCSGRTRWCCAR